MKLENIIVENSIGTKLRKITRPRNIDDDVYYYEDEYEYYDNEDYNRRRLENINRNNKINYPQKNLAVPLLHLDVL